MDKPCSDDGRRDFDFRFDRNIRNERPKRRLAGSTGSRVAA